MRVPVRYSSVKVADAVAREWVFDALVNKLCDEVLADEKAKRRHGKTSMCCAYQRIVDELASGWDRRRVSRPKRRWLARRAA